MLVLDYLLTATYADGFIYKQDQNDTSLFDGARSAFFDIDKQKLEAEHGGLTSLTCAPVDGRLTGMMVRFDQLPLTARPVYYRERLLEKDTETGEELRNETTFFFGYQYTDENGENQKHIKELE